MGSIESLAVAAVRLAAPRLVAGHAFPSKPITLICPWPAGGQVYERVGLLGK